MLQETLAMAYYEFAIMNYDIIVGGNSPYSISILGCKNSSENNCRF
jgi:hypothetical protein